MSACPCGSPDEKRKLGKDASEQAGHNRNSLNFYQGQRQHGGKTPGRGAAWGSFPASATA